MRFVHLAICASLASIAAPTYAVAAPETNAGRDRDDPNYVRCRRLDVTGSLVKKTRVCKTNAEWARLAEQGQGNAQEIFQNNLEGTSTHGN